MPGPTPGPRQGHARISSKAAPALGRGGLREPVFRQRIRTRQRRERGEALSLGEVVTIRVDVDRGYADSALRCSDSVPSDPTQRMGRAGVDISFWRSLTFLATAIAWPSLSTPKP
jgi:hypothetical protein